MSSKIEEGMRVIIDILRADLADISCLNQLEFDALIKLNGLKGTVVCKMADTRDGWHVMLDDYQGSGGEPQFRGKWLIPLTVLDLIAEEI